MPRILPAFVILALAEALWAASPPAADLVLTNCRIWTGDDARPEAGALAILGERIVAAGAAEDVDASRGPKTKVIDGRGRRVVPGFNDAHVHFVWGGQQLENVDLRDAPTPEEFVRRIEKQVGRTADNEWVVGGSWDDQRTTSGKLPTKELIDPVSPDTPVFVVRYDGHMGLANSRALRLAGITAKTPDPAGGLIARDAAGEPTGILKDAAMTLVKRSFPPPRPSKASASPNAPWRTPRASA